MYLSAVRRIRSTGTVPLSTYRYLVSQSRPAIYAPTGTYKPPISGRRRGGFGVINTTIDPTATQPAWQKTITDLVQTGLSVFQAERLRKENLERIRAGKAPLTDAQMRSLAPTANVNVALPPAIQYGALAGGAALLYLLATRRKR